MYVKNPEYFLTIAREGSISRAAEQLYLSQPYLSQHLARLEQSLGCTLLDRSHSPLRLTAAGELFCAYLDRQHYLDRQLDSDLRELCVEKRQVIRLGVALWRGATLLPEVLPVFNRRYPDVQVVIHEAPAPQMEELLTRDEADFCIMHAPTDTAELAYEPFLHERVLLVGHRDHPLLRDSASTLDRPLPFDLRRLENERFILLPPDWRLGRLVRNAFQAQNLEPRETILTTNNTTAVNLVAEGLGFTFLPESGISRSYGYQRLIPFTVGEPPLCCDTVIAYRKSGFLSPAARAFIALIKERCGICPPQ